MDIAAGVAHAGRRHRRARPAARAARSRRARVRRPARAPGCTCSCCSPPCCSAWPRCCATTRRRRSCPSIVDSRRSSRRPTGGCGAPRGSPTRSSVRRSDRCCCSVAFVLPFFVDAGSFFAAAALVALDPRHVPCRREPDDQPAGSRGKAELSEGVRWLWRHPLLRPMAIILGLMNVASMSSGSRRSCCSPRRCCDVGPFVFTHHGLRRRDRRRRSAATSPRASRGGSAAARAWR